jgi:hypothetical protein
VTFPPDVVFQWLYTASDAGVIWLASKNMNDCYPVSIFLAFEIHSGYLLLWLSTSISKHSRLSVSECRTTNEYTNAQYPLNITSVSKRRQKY